MTEETTTEVVQAPNDSLLTVIRDTPPAPLDFSTGRPETFPENFWDVEKNAPSVDKLFDAYTQAEKKALGLRQKLSRGEFEGKPPADISEYVLELAEEHKALAPDNDPLIQAAREVAKEAGLSKETFSKFMQPMIAKVAALRAEAETPPTPEEINEYKKQELAKLGGNGFRVAEEVNGFLVGLQAKGVLTKEDYATAQSMINSADALRLFNRLRFISDTPTVPTNVGDLNVAASVSELEAKMVAATNNRDEATVNNLIAQINKLKGGA